MTPPANAATANRATGKLSLSRPSGMMIRDIDRYYFENVFEAMNEPGEWYLNNETNTLYYVPQPGETQVMRVQSGDRWYFTLDEGGPDCRWDCVCDDSDVEVTIDHEYCGDESDRVSYGRAKVRIRVHRGYDGPSTIRFFCRKCRDRKGAPDRPFTICLYRRTGDAAFWE